MTSLSSFPIAVASSPHCYPDAAEEILKIIAMLPLSDTYAQTGYLGMGMPLLRQDVVNRHLTGRIKRSLKKLQEE